MTSQQRDAATRGRMVALSLATVYVVWSTTYLAVRYAVGSRSAAGLPPMSVGGLRYLSAGLVLAAFARLRGAPLPSRAQWMRTLPLSVLFFVMGNGFVALAERDLDSGVAALVCGTMPLWGAVLGLAFGDAVRVREWVGLAVGFAGMVALGSGADLRASPASWALLGVAPIAWAMGSVLARRLALPAGLMAPAAQMIAGGALMLALGAATGERWPAHAPASAWWAVGYLALMGSLAAFSAYVYLLRNARAPVAMSYAYVNPAAAVLLAAAMGDAQLRVRTLAATVLVVVGVVVMVTRKPTPAKSTA